MSKEQLHLALPLLSILMFFVVLVPAHGAEDELIVHKAGKEGHIGLNTTVVAGDLTLRPGRYTVQHRAEEGSHFVRFTRIDWRKRPSDKSRRRAALVEAEVTCEVEIVEKTLSSTAFYTKKEGGTTRLTRVEIKGEGIAHLF